MAHTTATPEDRFVVLSGNLTPGRSSWHVSSHFTDLPPDLADWSETPDQGSWIDNHGKQALLWWPVEPFHPYYGDHRGVVYRYWRNDPASANAGWSVDLLCGLAYLLPTVSGRPHRLDVSALNIVLAGSLRMDFVSNASEAVERARHYIDTMTGPNA